MGTRESWESDQNTGEALPDESPQKPRPPRPSRESQDETAPLHTAGYAGERASNGGPHRGQNPSEEDRDESEPGSDRESSLRGRLNPIGGGE